MIRITGRTARKLRRCEGCLHWISPGDRYLEHVVSPYNNDLGNSTWWRTPECSECAIRYGRGEKLL